jgi:hypothetical protein
LQSIVEHMNDGRFDPVAAGSAIKYERDTPAKFAHHMLGGGRAYAAESIGTGGRERFSEALDYGTKRGMGTHSYRDRILSGSHDIRHTGFFL